MIRRGLVVFTPIAGQNLIVNGRTHAALAVTTQNDSMRKSMVTNTNLQICNVVGYVGVCISSTLRHLIVPNDFAGGKHDIAVLTTDQLLRLTMSGIVDTRVHSSVTLSRASDNREQVRSSVC